LFFLDIVANIFFLGYTNFGDFMNLIDIERSIIKKYRKTIWRPFMKAIETYNLISPNDVIGVCISGGKDSMLLAKCLEELQKHGKIPFTLKYIVMDPGYNAENMEKIKENLNILGIDAHIFKTEIFSIADKSSKDSPCYLCAKMRRGYLYHEAQKLGCNKIALGHHFNDAVETILLNLIFNGLYSGMMPKLHSDNFENIELIRPLYLVHEEDIISWSHYNNLTFIDCACSVTKKSSGKRNEIKALVKDLKKIYGIADKCIFKSLENVNLDTVIEYKKNNKKYNFLDDYSSKF